MAGKSKSTKSNENSDASGVAETPEDNRQSRDAVADSIEDTPIVIDAEVEDVTERVDDKSPEDADTAASEAEPEAPYALEEAQQANANPGSSAPVLALIFGGLVAGALGYFAASLAPRPSFDASGLTSEIAANAEALEAVSSDLTVLKNAPAPELPDIDGRLGDITQSIAALKKDVASVQTGLDEARAGIEQQIVDLDARILALETAVPAASALSSDDELAALRRRITEMTEDAQARLAEARDEAEEISRAAEEARLAAEAEAAEARATTEAREAELRAMAERQATLIDLKAAVESGAVYADLIGEIDGVPDVLAANAETGVPTVQNLRSSFPTEARAVLAQAETVPEGASATERMAAFFQRRTNARSLTPQAGDGPDAILSRAEASLQEGNLPAALSELDGLPDAGKSVMSGWLERANTRVAALEAIDRLLATN